MKKTYIAPEVEITKFNTEDIMNSSVITVGGSESYSSADYKVASVDYDVLFKN